MRDGRIDPGIPRWKVAARRLLPRLARRPRHILGIACTGHGASIAYAGADGVLRSSVLDRWAGEKHVLLFAADEDRDIRNPQSEIDAGIHRILAFGFGRFPETRIFEEIIEPWVEWFLRGLNVRAADIDLLVTSDSHFATCAWRLGQRLKHWFPKAVLFSAVEHHGIHQRQAFWQSGFDEAAVLTLDTCGEDLERLGGRKIAGTICAMNARGDCKVLTEMLFPDESIGILYDAVNHHVGFVQGEEGKTMGLAPYGDPDLWGQIKPRLTLHANGGFSFIPYEEFCHLLCEYVPGRPPRTEMTKRHENVAYAGQAFVEATVSHAFQAALRLTGLKNLAYAGGIALNSVANQAAQRAARPAGLYVATNPGDTGHALGCVLLGAYEIAGWKPRLEEIPEYLGPAYSLGDMEEAARAAGCRIARPACPESALAQCIAQGYITARFDGRSEFGPRALGNRSILCDPRRGDMKDYLNTRVKHREAFRPFAPAVLEEHAIEWFDMEGRSSYMLRVVPVRAAVRERIPAIVHVDGTGRVQTVNREENPGFRMVIEEFHRLTEVPVVLNTSFNVAGKPIVETPADAVACFLSTEIDVLALGPLLLSKRPISEYLEKPR